VVDSGNWQYDDGQLNIFHSCIIVVSPNSFLNMHTKVHSSHATFTSAPLPLCLLLRGQTCWGKHTWKALSGKTFIIHY